MKQQPVTIVFDKRPIVGRWYLVQSAIPFSEERRRLVVVSFSDFYMGNGWALLQDEDGRQFNRAVLYGPWGLL